MGRGPSCMSLRLGIRIQGPGFESFGQKALPKAVHKPSMTSNEMQTLHAAEGPTKGFADFQRPTGSPAARSRTARKIDSRRLESHSSIRTENTHMLRDMPSLYHLQPEILPDKDRALGRLGLRLMKGLPCMVQPGKASRRHGPGIARRSPEAWGAITPHPTRDVEPGQGLNRLQTRISWFCTR